jgi:hypothetical protein
VIKVRDGGDLIVIGRLAEAIERVTGVELRAVGEMLEVGDGDDFALGDAMDIDIGAEAILHAILAEALLELGELLIGL